MEKTKKKFIINTFDKMWADSLLSLQDNKSYKEGWNLVNKTDKEKDFGVALESSNELFTELNGDVRGSIFVEERNQYVVFLLTKDGGEIGIIDRDTKQYTTITTPEITKKLDICVDEWIDVEVKIMQPCGNLFLYWSSKNVYKRINLDDDCCDFDDIELIKRVSVSDIKTIVYEKGGVLPNGKYFFSARARDGEGNYSNWSDIVGGVSIADGDKKAGELSRMAINLDIESTDNPDYNIVDIAVIKVINNQITIEKVASISSTTKTGGYTYLYRGETGDEVSMKLSDILNRTNRFIRGKKLQQYEDRLILYKLLNEKNLNYQSLASEIKARYTVNAVPIEEAHRFKSLTHFENYQYAIHWNYDDGTHSVDYPLIPEVADKEKCDSFTDNSERLETFVDESVFAKYSKTVELRGSTPFDDTKLHEDESLGVPENQVEDAGIGDYIDGKISEIDHIGQETKNSLDCLCEFVEEWSKNRAPGVSWYTTGGRNWDLDDDLIGAITLGQLVCMCAERKQTSGNYHSRGGGENTPQVKKKTVANGCGGETVIVTDDQADALLESLQNRSTGASTCTGSNCSSAGSGCSSSNGAVGAPKTGAPYTEAVEGKRIERTVEFTRNRIKSHIEGLKSNKKLFKNSEQKVCQGAPCSDNSLKTCVGDICYECKDNMWYVINNIEAAKTNSDYVVIRSVDGKNVKPGEVSIPKDLDFNIIYNEDGCTVKEIKPVKIAEGKFGVKVINEKYPMTIDCDCDYIYGDSAGKNVRLFRAPSVSKEPHFLSYGSGVPNRYEFNNSEFNGGFALMLGLKFTNIKSPENPPKPLCKKKPYTLTMVEVTESNKTVLASGLSHSCFLGESGGEIKAFPKHGVNSFERFDRSIEPSGTSSFRGGFKSDVGAYTVHSPDLHLNKPPLLATHILFEGEMYGLGFRHGLFAEGEEPETTKSDKVNHKGTRQSINLNNFDTYKEHVVREVKGLSYAEANSVVTASNKFTYSLSNVKRESSVYLEVEGGLVPFARTDMKDSLYGGIDNKDGKRADKASDRSFTGDTFTESLPIYDARSHYITMVRSLPNQYGSLIFQNYIPTGLSGEMVDGEISDTVEGLGGNSYINTMTYKRKALVSDKTNRVISRFTNPGGLNATDIWIKILLANFLSFIFRSLGLRNGGLIPDNQDSSSFIRMFGGLRFIDATTKAKGSGVLHPGEVHENLIPPPFPHNDPQYMTRTSIVVDVNYGDNYFPQTLTTQIVSFFTSSVNPDYRELGDVENGEVYYSQNASTLKGLNLDTTIPEDSKIKDSWLARWGSRMIVNAKWKIYVQAAILFVFTYLIGFYFMVEGVGNVVNGLQAVGGGMYMLQTIGALLAVGLGIMLIFLGITWIGWWIKSDGDNKVVATFLGLKGLRPDRKNADGSYSFNEDELLKFEDNYFHYDNTHSQENVFETTYGMTDPYNVCECTNYTNKMIWSNPQIRDSQIDAWRNFKPNNDIEITSDLGMLQNMFVLGNTLFAHTTDNLLRIHSNPNLPNLSNINFGTGDLIKKASPIYGGVIEGFAGLIDENAPVITAIGYIFPDRESRRFYKFTGGGLPEPIGFNKGMETFMDNNMYFKLLEHFPDYKNVDLKLQNGIGFSIAIDHQLNRLLITKLDYEPAHDDIKLGDDNMTFKHKGNNISVFDEKHFINKSFTLSYDYVKKVWVSFHSYTPHLYFWDRFHFYSFNQKGLWRHNSKEGFLHFYDEYAEASLEYIVNDRETLKPFGYISTNIQSEAYQWIDEELYTYSNKTFDSVLFYNKHQSSGILDFVDVKTLSVVDRSKDRKGVNLTSTESSHTFSDIKDRLINKNELILESNGKLGPMKPIVENHGDIKNNLFYGNYLVNRLIFRKFADIKLLVKAAITEIQNIKV